MGREGEGFQDLCRAYGKVVEKLWNRFCIFKLEVEFSTLRIVNWSYCEPAVLLCVDLAVCIVEQ